MGFLAASCVTPPPNNQPVLSLQNDTSLVRELFHYTADLAQTDLPKGSFVCEACVGNWKDARDATGAQLKHAVIKRRAFRVTQNALDKYFDQLPNPSYALWMEEYESETTIPAVHLLDTSLPKP